jgi:hypothetical protein
MVQGIPVWKATDGALYAYDTEQPLLRIGTGEEFEVGWEAAYAERLAAYRAAAAPRARATAGSAKK